MALSQAAYAAIASSQLAETGGGNSTPTTIRVLMGLMDRYAPRHTLEIGLGQGVSALAFTSYHKTSKDGGSHTSIDGYQESTWNRIGIRTIERADLQEWFDFRSGLSALELPKLLEAGRRFGLIYVDGSHLFDDVFVDVYYAVRLLDDGAIVAFDDSAKPHVAKVIAYMKAHMAHCMRELDLSGFRNDNALVYRLARWMDRVQLRAFQKVGAVDRDWETTAVRF